MAQTLAVNGEWTEVIDVCQLILARDNCWENAYRMLMTAYYRNGNRAQALRVYQKCVQSLRRELDVEPTPATRKLYHAILTEYEEA